MTMILFRYFAGKSRLAKQLISMMPPHRCYVEPFGGSGTVLLNKQPSKVEVFNDIYLNLINLFICIKKFPTELRREAEAIPYSRHLFAKYSLELRNKDFKIPDPIRAAKFWFHQNASFNGLTPEYSTLGSFSFSKVKSTALEWAQKIEKLDVASWRFKNVIVESLDFRECIEKYDGLSTLFYLDPPYYSADNASGIEFSEKDHEDLHNLLSKVVGKWILTYDNDPAIRQLYKEYNLRFSALLSTTQSTQQSSNVRLNHVHHLIISNFKTL